MSYFKAQVGRPLNHSMKKKEPRPSKKSFSQKALFAASSAAQRPTRQKGAQKQDQTVGKKVETSRSLTCPLCRAGLQNEKGLYRCQGRCKTLWLEEQAGRLIDLAALPYGICCCCEQPQALAQSDLGAICPLSHQEYLLLTTGPTPLDEAAPHGLCSCCLPPRPLIEQDGAWRCQVKPYHCYEVQNGQVRLISPLAPADRSAETLAAIDQALRQNSARLTTYGLFDVE